MNDLPIGRPIPGGSSGNSEIGAAGSGRLDPRSVNERSGMGRSQTTGPDTASGYVGQRGSRRSPPTGFGSIIGFFVGLMVVFIFAAAIAQYAVRGDGHAGASASTAIAACRRQSWRQHHARCGHALNANPEPRDAQHCGACHKRLVRLIAVALVSAWLFSQPCADRVDGANDMPLRMFFAPTDNARLGMIGNR